MVNYLYKEFKSAINTLKFPDSWFWCRCTINPYQGCQHSCIYCDARSARYYVEDFENEVIIKKNIDKILDTKLRNTRSLLPDVIGPGGVCDAYQQIEEEAENTLKILKVIAKHHYPVNIATKNSLILRDIELLEEIGRDTWCTIGFSITTTDDELARFLEPFSSPPSERIKAIKAIKAKAPHIQIGTYLIPILPFLTDTNENLEDIIKKTKEAGGDFLLFSPGLTLRDAQKEYFIKKLQKSSYKEIIASLIEMYRGNIYPPGDYARTIHAKLLNLCEEFNLPFREKRWIPKDFRKWNYKISEFLLNREYETMLRTGKSDNTMKWAGLTLNNFKESIIDLYKNGTLASKKNFSKRIIDLIDPIIKNSKEFNQRKGLDRYL
ncbi:MAG: radical SAM protein [Promethearchaeota archaeon]|nr:MAG: radical SAM protein [Candidatus Lokiarchaeota archaeon]